MPDAYAHDRFGQFILAKLPESLQKTIENYKDEYDLGLLGPDIFFFHKPYRKNSISGYGKATHRQSATGMFSYAVQHVECEASLSYLAGLICHYALDSRAHPYVNTNSKTSFEHLRMETCYDAHLMLKDGKGKPRRGLFSGEPDYEAMAALWSSISAKTVKSCIRSRNKYIHLLNVRKIVMLAEVMTGKPGTFSCMLLPEHVPPEQADQMQCLDAIFAEALAVCPEMVKETTDSAKTHGKVPAYFYLNFAGKE